MTKDEFQNETHDFITRNEQEARAKATEYNAKGVEGDTIVAVKLGEYWCVMLSDAFASIHEFNVK
jgi:hypothetical protein